MLDKARAIRTLQKQITEYQAGILFLIDLTNSDQLNVIIDDESTILDQFRSIVESACKESGMQYRIIQYIDATKLYILISEKSAIVSREKISQFTHSIYYSTQLHFDTKYTELYFKFKTGSIQFNVNNRSSISQLLSLLNISMASNPHQDYYHCYEDNVVNIVNIRNLNHRLNYLRYALSQKKIKFMYQPIIDTTSQKIIYHECLLRIIDTNNNLISIGDIIHEVESSGLIHRIDSTVLDMVIDELQRDKESVLSINISALGVLNNGLLHKVQNLLQQNDIGNRLIIEITETGFNKDLQATQAFINTLHQYGCKVAIDDFGAGFTAFKQLTNLPIDIIKIDGSYIRDILHNNHNKIFVEAIIRIAQQMNITTIAEFVNNKETVIVLKELNIDAMQGNFFFPAVETRKMNYVAKPIKLDTLLA